jgi:PAS domain S-box-containing protein
VSIVDERVVVLAPSAHDGPVTVGILANAGFDCALVRDVAELCHAMRAGAAVVVVAQEALAQDGTQQLAELLAQQEPWSDMPIVVFIGRGPGGTHASVAALAGSGNVTLLERPLETITLVSAVRAGLRARHRQYAARGVLGDLRRAIERHERQVRLFEGIASTTLDFVYLFDLQGRFLYANRRLLEVWGMQLPEVIGRTPRELGYEQWHHDMHMREIAQVIETRLPIKGEVPFQAPRTGIFGIYEYIFTPVIGPDGSVEVIAGTTRDVTDRKRAEDALRDADRRKSEFLAVLSHELRNPLAPIRNSISLLERAEPGSEVAARAREVMRRQTEHLTRLVDDLLDVTRISVGKIELQRSHVDLRDIVQKTTDDLQSVFTLGAVDLRVEYVTLGPVWIDADPTRMAQVLGNLLHNAVKFTPSGGTVRVSVGARDGRAELSVRDDGAGMDPGTIEDMFAPFAQADHTLARTSGGLGLGLALVKGLVELHGGTVSARSDGIGHGAEFLVSLPLVKSEPASRAMQSRGESAAKPRAIVLIEDNVDGAQSLAEILSLHGHSVRVARDGRSGIELARELRPDFVLCDIGLPDLDGYEVARALRSEEALKATRLVALSGYAQPEDRQRAREAGFDTHLPKPADLQQLMDVLAQAG